MKTQKAIDTLLAEWRPQVVVPVEIAEVGLEAAALAEGPRVKPEERSTLLRQVRAGEVDKLYVAAKVFLQAAGAPMPLPKAMRHLANANFSRFFDHELGDFAGSFKGARFLRDHNTYAMAACGGRIADSVLVERDGGATFQIRQSLELVKQWAMEDALDGTMSSFSIGWGPKKSGWAGFQESLLCSVCSASLLKCSHWPGDVVVLKKSTGEETEVIVEAVWTKVRGRETSEVLFPAVQGTGVGDIRTALSEMRALAPSGTTPTQEHDVDPELAAALGLSTDEATNPKKAVQAAIRLRKQLTDLESANGELRVQLEQTQDDLAKEKSARALELKKRHEADLKVLRESGLKDGRLLEGSDAMAMFDELAAEDLDRARRFLSALKPAAPVGQPLHSRRDPRAPTPPEANGVLTASQRRINKQLGLSDEDFLRFSRQTETTIEGEEE